MPPKPQQNHIIAVIGASGSGKSTFINSAAGREYLKVGHSLTPCTTEITAVPVPHPRDHNKSVIFVDTVGFEDTYKSDSEILNMTATWLREQYHARRYVDGVIYLHSIRWERMNSTSYRNIKAFMQVCGEDALSSVVLVTTKWRKDERELQENRELQLRDLYWGKMTAAGSRMMRFDPDAGDSAWAIVDAILEARKTQALQVQSEMHARLIAATATGTLSHELSAAQAELRRALKARETGDPNMIQVETLQEHVGILKRVEKQMAKRGSSFVRKFWDTIFKRKLDTVP